MNNQPNPYNPHGTTPTYYQPQYGTPPVYVVQGQNYSPTASAFAHRSPWLLAFGIIDVCLSGIFFIWGLVISFGWSTTVSPYISTTSTIFHLVLGVLSIIGARDGVRYRGCLIASLVMGIVGPCIFVCATMTSDIIEWASYPSTCHYCHEYTDICPALCDIDYNMIFIPILIYSIFQAIVSIVLSSISCCNLCYCCGCCYTGNNTPSQSLMFQGSPPPYVTLAVPQDIPTTSSGAVEPNLPNYK